MKAHESCRRALAAAAGLIGLTMVCRGAVAAGSQPSAAMLEPVHRLVDFMSSPRGRDHPAMFARHGLCILENFAPYQFCGPDAAAAWEAGYRAHSEAEDEAELAARFDPAQDFGESGDRVYFSLPTTWTGLSHGRRFEEHGAWEFVLERDGPRWLILSYGWGVTSRAPPP